MAANNLFRFDNVHLKNTVETTTVESLSQDSTIFADVRQRANFSLLAIL